jgi:cytochrome c553
MNNWFKIGLPVLIAILLVVSAVSVTLAVTAGNSARQANAAVYQPGSPSTVQYAGGAYCHGYYGTQAAGNTYSSRNGGCPMRGWRNGS